MGERVSTLGGNKSQDTRSKLQSSRDSEFREFKKTKVKLNNVSSMGNQSIEEQIKREIAAAVGLLKECEGVVRRRGAGS